MTREPAGSDKVSTYRLQRAQSRRGAATPPRRPPVLLRAKPCGCRLGVVVLDQYGWHIQGDRFREPVPRWMERMRAQFGDMVGDVELTLENYRAGLFAAFQPGVVAGFQWTQPTDLEDWDLRSRQSFEVGCSRHRLSGEVQMRELQAACRAFVACRTGQRCDVALT